jgi:putative aldouronate transport system substrate-binding protein
MSICGDDFVADSNNVSEFSWLGDKYSKKVYAIKDELVNETSIYPIDKATYGFTSDAQNMMTEIDYKSILANLIVAEGDLEENWKNVIAEYAYIVDPAVAELNELFGAK